MTQDCTPMLLNVYQTIYGESITMANLNELAATLSQIAQRDRPWTGKYLHSLLKGYAGFTATDKLIETLTIFQRQLAGEDEVMAHATKATVLAIHPLSAQTVILGKAQYCATPGCLVQFVPTHPRQKYHSKPCARRGRRRRNA